MKLWHQTSTMELEHFGSWVRFSGNHNSTGTYRIELKLGSILALILKYPHPKFQLLTPSSSRDIAPNVQPPRYAGWSPPTQRTQKWISRQGKGVRSQSKHTDRLSRTLRCFYSTWNHSNPTRIDWDITILQETAFTAVRKREKLLLLQFCEPRRA